MPEGKPCRVRSAPTLLAALVLAGFLATPGMAQRDSERKQIEAPRPGPSVIGTSAPIRLEPKLEQAFENNGTMLWADAIGVPGVSFLKAHLVDVNLRAGDVLRLLSASGQVVDEIRGRGPKDQGSFWALAAFGDELVLEFRFTGDYAKAPFRIDQVILGDPAILSPDKDAESICTPENFDDVFCYQSDSLKWSNVLASVGVMSVGGNPVSALFCSGSNVSPQNYVLTNQHCITSQASCDNSEFVFKFYRTGCNSGAPITTDWQGFRCDDVVATKPFISCDQGLADLDYALCSVIGDPNATFGHVTPDPVPLTDGEGIYIIQHPAGRPHEIAHGSGANVDVAGTVLRYYGPLDTEGGSSGSPIFRESDGKLVGLHHCGGCETPGVGNRGMLMADIYPDIETFLCTGTVEVAATTAGAFTQVLGDGDTVLEPGEVWRFKPRVRNGACDLMALGVQAEIAVNAASAGHVQLLQNLASFGDVPAGTAVEASTAVRFRVLRSAPCGTPVTFDLVNLQATNGGPWSDTLAYASKPVGEAPQTTLFFDDFSGPPTWSVVNGGTGSGAASTWTTGNPGGRSLPLTAPYYIADSDALGTGQTMDEQLISPLIDCTGFTTITLQFSHAFRWFSGGLDEQCDVELRSSATGGAWSLVANFQDADTSGTVSYDVSAKAAGQSDVELRFHYSNAVFEWWWAVDDVYVLGTNGFECDVFGNDQIIDKTPLPPGMGTKP